MKNSNKKLCPIPDCRKTGHCKTLCQFHYNLFHKGKMDMQGNFLNGYKPLATKCCVKDCTKGRKDMLRKGLCNKHRRWKIKGIIDEKGTVIRPDLLPKGKEYYSCKMSKCVRKHKAHGFCKVHYASYKITKTLDISGNLTKAHIYKKYDYKQDKCKLRTCTRDGRLSKGFCMFHYQLFNRKQIDQFGQPVPGSNYIPSKKNTPKPKKPRKEIQPLYMKSKMYDYLD